MFWDFVAAVFSSWVEKAGIGLTLLPLIEKIPIIKRWLDDRPILERFSPLLWVIGLACIFSGFYSAWSDEHGKVLAQKAYLKPWLQLTYTPGAFPPSQPLAMNTYWQVGAGEFPASNAITYAKSYLRSNWSDETQKEIVTDFKKFVVEQSSQDKSRGVEGVP